jgi:hypothetical protein
MVGIRPSLFPLPVALICLPILFRFFVRPQLANRMKRSTPGEARLWSSSLFCALCHRGC